ncbi:MAG TPA: glycosyl transferase, partial [Sporomusa sp.]|nr:glycosyl transferase [Sporomusa sp.]
SQFSNEILLRKQQWLETIKTDPEWILNLDADEIFEDQFKYEIRQLTDISDVYVYNFRLFDFWDEKHYREDQFWCAHRYYRPFLARYNRNFNYIWNEQPQHCGRFPVNILELPNRTSELRLKHLGWARETDRLEKYHRYKRLDPGSVYGLKGQYESILDHKPVLIKWVE